MVLDVRRPWTGRRGLGMQGPPGQRVRRVRLVHAVGGWVSRRGPRARGTRGCVSASSESRAWAAIGSSSLADPSWWEVDAASRLGPELEDGDVGWDSRPVCRFADRSEPLDACRATAAEPGVVNARPPVLGASKLELKGPGVLPRGVLQSHRIGEGHLHDLPSVRAVQVVPVYHPGSLLHLHPATSPGSAPSTTVPSWPSIVSGQSPTSLILRPISWEGVVAALLRAMGSPVPCL